MEARRTRKLRNVLLVPLEWTGIGLGLCIIPWLPRPWLYGLCDALSRVMYRFDRRGKRRALANLRIVRGARPPIHGLFSFNPDKVSYNPTRDEERIIRRSYRNMARTVGYAFWTCRRAKERAAATGVMCEEGRRFLAENRPAVTVSGHIGCWEILSQLAFLEGHPMMSVAKDIGTSGMTALLMRARRSIGQEIVHADGAFKPLMQGLKDGKSLGLLVDQSVSPKHGGVWVRFFGYPMTVSAAPAFFAAKGHMPRQGLEQPNRIEPSTHFPQPHQPLSRVQAWASHSCLQQQTKDFSLWDLGIWFVFPLPCDHDFFRT